MTTATSSEPASSTTPAEFLMGEVTTVKEVAARLAAGEISDETKVTLDRGVVVAPSKEEAIGVLASRDDREGTSYSAQTKRYYLERTPKKTIRWA